MKKKLLMMTLMLCIGCFILYGVYELNSFARDGFSDLDESHWAYEQVMDLVEMGVINGYENGEYRPNKSITYKEFLKLLVVAMNGEVEPDASDWSKPYIDYSIDNGWLYENEFDYDEEITRQACALIISRTLALDEAIVSSYIRYIKDYDQINEAYKLSVLNVYAKGILSGNTELKFNPINSLSRAECAVVMMRVINEDYRNYIILDEIESLDITSIRSFENDLIKIHSINDIDVMNNATLGVIRKDKYGDYSSLVMRSFWAAMAGSIPIDYKTYLVSATDDEILDDLSEIENFTDPVTGETIDFKHMAVVIDTLYSDNTAVEDDIEAYLDYLCGFSGDLETFTSNLVVYNDFEYTGDYKAKYNYAYNYIGSSEGYYFDNEDLLADIDGVNIANMMIERGYLLSEAMRLYYESDMVNNRYELFIDSFGGEEDFKEVIVSLADGDATMLSQDFFTFRTLLLFSAGLNISELPGEEDSLAVYNAFYDLIIDRSKE